jgi:hypothetical protein
MQQRTSLHIKDVLHLTGGMGYSASIDMQNWYTIATATEDGGATHLPIVGNWMIATPDGTTTYEILPMNECVYTVPAAGIGIDIIDSTNIILRNIGFSSSGAGGFQIRTTDLSNGTSFVQSEYNVKAWVGLYFTASSGTGQYPIYNTGDGSIALVATRIDGQSRLHALVSDVGKPFVWIRSFYADRCDAGLWIGPSYYIVAGALMATNTNGIYIEEGMMTQSLGVYVRDSTGVGLFLGQMGAKVILFGNNRIANNAGGDVVNQNACAQLLGATTVVVGNVSTILNGVTFGSTSTTGSHSQATGGLWQ